MSFDLCKNVYVHDIHFDTTVKNGDGIDFRAGCSCCRVENITGYTSDDTVACTALRFTVDYPYKNYLYPLEPASSVYNPEDPREFDIHDIDISGIYTGGTCHGVICLAAGGLRVYNISIKDVVESKYGARNAAVEIYTGYAGGYEDGDLHDITADGVVSHISAYAFKCNARVKNVTVKNAVQKRRLGPEGKYETYDIKYPEGITILPGGN